VDVKPIVCIVEDEPLVCRSLAQLFQSAGLECSCYSTAPDFLAALDPHRPACILIDFQLPGMSGLELQEKLVDRGCTHPIIFLTAHADVSLAVNAMKHGAFDFL
jgi:two-component system response regulator DctR/two-component system response regulator FixJ